MNAFRKIRVLAVVAFATFAVAACGDDSPTSPGPGIQPQVMNMTDDFAYQVSNVRNYSGTLSYTWRNTGVQANVNQATTVTAGTLTLVIRDASGTEVYSRSLADNGTFITAAGDTGMWNIRVVYSGMSGTVNFRAQKKT
jgi:hypothetical protein